MKDILVLFVFLPIVIICIYISMKLGRKYMWKMNNGGLIKIVEKVPLSQNSYIAIVSIDNKPYVISCCDKQIQLLMELDSDALLRAKKPVGLDDRIINTSTLSELLNKVKGRFENEKTS